MAEMIVDEELWMPQIALHGISAAAFLDLRNGFMRRGFFLSDWAYEPERQQGVLEIGGIENPKSGERYSLSHKGISRANIQKAIRDLMTLAISEAKITMFGTNQGFRDFPKQREKHLATPQACGRNLFMILGNHSPVFTVVNNQPDADQES